jgi:hypothetical protein
MPVSGTTRMTPPMMMNAWMPMIVVRPVARSFSNGRSARIAMRRPAPMHQQERDEHRGGADQTELLADRGEDEVVLASGILLGLPSPRPVPSMPPFGEREHRLRDLVAACPRTGGHGSSQIATRVCTLPNRRHAMYAAPAKSTTPITR